MRQNGRRFHHAITLHVFLTKLVLRGLILQKYCVWCLCMYILFYIYALTGLCRFDSERIYIWEQSWNVHLIMTKLAWSFWSHLCGWQDIRIQLTNTHTHTHTLSPQITMIKMRESERDRDRQRDWQAGRQTRPDRQTDRQNLGEREGQRETETNRPGEGGRDRQTDRQAQIYSVRGRWSDSTYTVWPTVTAYTDDQVLWLQTRGTADDSIHGHQNQVGSVVAKKKEKEVDTIKDWKLSLAGAATSIIFFATKVLSRQT